MDELPDKDGVYEVYRDDQKIGETTNQEFIDYHVKSGEKYNYSIQVSLDPPEAKKKRSRKRYKNRVQIFQKKKNLKS